MSLIRQLTAVIFIVLCYITNSCCYERLDCTKMVFHPRCRGISAKRSIHTASLDDWENSFSSDEKEDFSVLKNQFGTDITDRILREFVLASLKSKAKKSYHLYDEEK